MTARWRATSRAELEQIGGWVHDAYFEWEDVGHDPSTGVVTVPFQQEPSSEEECGQPGARLVAHRPLGASVYKVPFVRCTATLRHATACVVDGRHRDDPGMLDVIEAGASASEIVFAPVTGPEIRAWVDAIDVEIEMTDEIVFYVRRVTGRLAATDSRWEDPPA